MKMTMPDQQVPRVEAAFGSSVGPRAVAASWAERRDPLRRRWGRIGGGLLAALVGAWLFSSLYLSAGDRREVLVMADGVARFATIERSDLRVVRVSGDAQVQSVAATRMDEVVGRVAATDLSAGSLLAEGQLLDSGERLVKADEAVIGVLVGPGDAPVTTVERGADVSLVVRPPAGAVGEVSEVAGWVAGVSGTVSSNGDRPIDVVVPRRNAAAVSAAAAERRVTLVVLGD